MAGRLNLLRMVNLHYPVVLASQSPRRKELLLRLVADFEVLPADVDETPVAGQDPWQTAQRIAREKALTVFERRPESIVIGGDTVVAIQESGGYRLLGKPKTLNEAKQMLQSLSGRDHFVVTGIAIRWPKGYQAFTSTTKVLFREITDAEIEAYVQTGEPMDKAGAYAVQGGAANFVARLEGSLDNVIGLPVDDLAEALKGIGK